MNWIRALARAIVLSDPQFQAILERMRQDNEARAIERRNQADAQAYAEMVAAQFNARRPPLTIEDKRGDR